MNTAALSEFHRRLLPATLQNALRTQLYRSLWAELNVDSVRVETLSTLPTVDKETIRSAGMDGQVRAGLVCDEVFTSGTTGPPLITVRGNREQEYIRRFFLEIHERQHGNPLKRGLQINNPYHGYQIGVPTPIHFHRISIYDKGSFDHGRHVLTSDHYDANVEPRCSVLIGLERCLRAFTYDTHRRFPEGLPTHLTYVLSYSQYLTRRWRQRFKETWGCSILDRYSLAEVFGGATQCLTCGWWHFDAFVIPEVVSPGDGRPIREGHGILLLTALYPFQEAQPIIRYITGDLVQVTYSLSCQPGVLSMRPLGRARYGVPLRDGTGWLLTPAAILEAVDELPDIARMPRFRDAVQVLDPFAIGHPKYHVRYIEANDVMRITLRLAAVSTLPAGRRAAIKNRLHEALSRESKEFASRLRQGDVMLDVLFSSDLEPDLISYSE